MPRDMADLTAIKKDESIFAAYDKAEMRKAKIMVVANSEFVYTSKSLFWPDVIMLAAVDLDLLQSVSLAIGVQRQTEMNPISKLHRRCKEDAKWSDAIRQQIILNNRRRLVDSR